MAISVRSTRNRNTTRGQWRRPRGHLDAAPSCARAVRHLVISRCPREPPRTRSAHIWVDCPAAPSSTSPAALHVPPDTFSHLRQDGDEYVPLPTWVTTDRLRMTHGPVLTGRTRTLAISPCCGSLSPWGRGPGLRRIPMTTLSSLSSCHPSRPEASRPIIRPGLWRLVPPPTGRGFFPEAPESPWLDHGADLPEMPRHVRISWVNTVDPAL